MLGVVAGLGVSAGAAHRLRRLAPVAVGVSLFVGLVIVLAALPYWAGVALAAGLALGAVSARRLSAAALPAAVLATAALAFVPVAGYLAAVAAPLLRWRLGRRAAGRYAGLRVLARD